MGLLLLAAGCGTSSASSPPHPSMTSRTPASTTTQALATTPTTLAPLPRVVACAGASRSSNRPASLTLACDTGESALVHVIWSSWAQTGALGAGTLAVTRAFRIAPWVEPSINRLSSCSQSRERRLASFSSRWSRSSGPPRARSRSPNASPLTAQLEQGRHRPRQRSAPLRSPSSTRRLVQSISTRPGRAALASTPIRRTSSSSSPGSSPVRRGSRLSVK